MVWYDTIYRLLVFYTIWIHWHACSFTQHQEPMLKCYPNALILRVRMPVSDDLFHRNFVTKIVKYEKVSIIHICDCHFSYTADSH
jgi:endonuclease/exonuclease/phosphatase family metal-dependent hydrolase